MRVVVLLVGLSFFASAAESRAQFRCGTCLMLRDPNRKLWCEEVSRHDFVLVGRVAGNRLDADSGTQKQGTTLIKIDGIVRGQHALRERTTVTLNEYTEIDPTKPPQAYLVFGDAKMGQIQDVWGIRISSPSLVSEYLRGNLAIKDADVPKRLAYCLAFLDSTEPAIVNDVLNEVLRAWPHDLIVHGKSLERNTVLKRVVDPQFNNSQRGCLIYLLAGCGKSEDAPLLRDMLDKYRSGMTPLDAILVALTILSPETGIAEIVKIARDPKRDFLERYASLRALRYLYDYPAKPLDRDSIVANVAAMLDHEDTADLAMDDLRRWQRWEYTGKILGYYESKSHQIPIVKRCIIRFALCDSKNPTAVEFVKQRRAENPDRVKEIEQLLELDQITEKAVEKK